MVPGLAFVGGVDILLIPDVAYLTLRLILILIPVSGYGPLGRARRCGVGVLLAALNVLRGVLHSSR